MFRLSTLLSQTRTSFWRLRNRPETQIQTVPFSLSPTCAYMKSKDKQREACPPKPIVCRKKRDDTILFGIAALLLLTGGCAAYCKQNQATRDYLSLYCPWFDDLVALIFKENMTYKQALGCGWDYLMEATSWLKPCIEDVKEVFEKKKGTKKKLAEPVATVCIEEEPKVEDESLTPEQSVCGELKQPFVIKDMCQIEECMWDQAETSINNYFTASEACCYYCKHIEDVMRTFTLAKLKTIETELKTKDALVQKHLCVAEDAEKALYLLEEEMNRAAESNVAIMDCPEKVESCKAALKDLKDRVKIAKIQFLWSQDRAKAWDKAWPAISGVVTRYMMENQSIYPRLNYCDERPRVYHDLDWLLNHTLRYLDQMCKDLVRVSKGISERIDAAYCMLPGKREEIQKKQAAINARKLDELYKDYSDRLAEEKKATDQETNRLKQAAQEKFEKDLEANIKKKENELRAMAAKKLEAEVEKERKKLNEIIKEMAAKLKQVQTKFYAHIKADKERNRSRALYAAGMSLLAKCQKGDPIVPVEKEIDEIERNRGFCDELVVTVISSIPDAVRRKGVVPESQLRARYRTMETLAMRVSMVESEGSPLIVYIMSFLQSLVLFVKLHNIPQAEKDSPPEEPFKNLDTFDLLQRSRYYMDRGNMAEAARYVNALQGASRAAAAYWYEDVKAYLETRQAAEAVIAHAAAIGLKYM